MGQSGAAPELEAQEDGRGFLDELLGPGSPAPAGRELIVGRLCGRAETGAPLVDFPGNPTEAPLPARSTVALTGPAAGREVALLFEDGQLRRPVIIGLLEPPATDAPATAVIDGREIVLEGEERIELRCGKARIVLTKDGKVLVKGTDILSRSEGPNRLKGASIQIN